MFQEQVSEVKEKIKEFQPMKKVLKNLDLFVLDNSLRETTVGQLRGHTIENKWQIYNEVCFNLFNKGYIIQYALKATVNVLCRRLTYIFRKQKA